MKNNLNEQNRNMDTLCCFHHRYTFYVCNLHEIVSAQVVKSRVDYYQTPDKKGYFWGQYEVQVSYRRLKERGGTRQKVFTHGFLINVPCSLSGFSKEEQRKYVCEVTCSYQAAPFLLMLFPFFSRINFVPFKVVLNVTGRIRESKGETISGGTECGCLERGEECSCLKNEREQLCQRSEPEEFIHTLKKDAWLDQAWEEEGWDVLDKVKAEKEDVVDLDLVALGKKGITPNHDAKRDRSRAHDLYCNMLIEHQESIQQAQPKNNSAIGKAVNKRQKKQPR
jgi:hypothetical protein